ncbi:MAG: FMN-dependent NADH-azoreductase [Cellvibrionaceae bacterium]
MTTLRIDSSARLEDSNTRQITQYIVDRLDAKVIERDLVKDPLPLISGEDLMGVHGSSTEPRESLRDHLALSDTLIAELKSVDSIVFGVPMYNFTIPSVLKQWVDYVCRAGQTFRYTSEGPQGLSGVKRAYIVTATGGTPVAGAMDFASGYLALICQVMGIEEIHQIDASGSKGDPESIIASAKVQVQQLLPA